MNNRPSELKPEDLEVITAMNAVYFEEKGRPGVRYSYTQARFAADYFLRLLEGLYIDSPSQLERRIKADVPQELVIRRALNAFTDFTQSGLSFLYHVDANIPDDVMRAIASKLIEKIEGANFTDRQCAETAIAVLTGMNGSVLLSARNTWLDDHYSPPRVPYDAVITNTDIIPEAVQYARKNVPFIK